MAAVIYESIMISSDSTNKKDDIWSLLVVNSRPMEIPILLVIMVEHRLANARKSIVNDAILSENTMEFLIIRIMEIKKKSYSQIRLLWKNSTSDVKWEIVIFFR